MRPTDEQLGQVYDQGKDATVAFLNVLLDKVEALESRVTTLEAKLTATQGATSKNSNTPPSQDPYRAKAQPKKQRRRRHNHHSGGRNLRPLADVGKVIDLRPARCAYCGLPLSEHAQHMGLPGRYQQVEIPAPTSELTEWRRHSLKCGGCGHTTKADVPDEALQRFGPRLKAMIASLGADKRQTNRQLQQLLSDLYEVDVSVGQIVNVAREVGGLLMPAAKRLRDEILSRAAVYADETSWRVARARAYLWGLFSRDAAYYEIHGTRSGEVAEQLIPVGYTGVVHTDDYGGYNHIADERRQLCWAHLKRHFQKRAESRDGPAAALEREFGLRGLRICERVFELSRQSTARQRARLVADMDALVADGLCAGATKDTRTMATTLAKRRGSLWHCLYSADVDATNNHAERYIRPAVIKRKLSLGSGSQGGAQALAALMSVATTARMRGRSPLVFIEATVRAAQNGQPLPVMS